VPAVSGRTFDTINPADGTRLTSVAHGQEADINLAVKAAREAFENGPWRKMSPSERGKMLHRVGDLILKHAEELSQLEALDNGKPVVVAKIADVGLSADIFHYMSGWTTKIHGRTFPNSVAGLIAPASARFLTSTLKEPIGVIGQVIPWNFPLLMAAWKLAPALACGNVSVLKPAEQTPLTALRLGEILQEAGIPDGVVNIVTGHGDAGAAIAAHPGVDKIAFTGSTEVGKLIVKAAAGNLKKVTLELGGKSPNVVFKDAKNAPGGMEAAIAGAASSIFFNQGQTCCAGSRLMVEQEVFDEVIEGVSKIANSIKIGHGIDPTTQLGPLVSSEQFDRVRGYMTQGKQDGACFNAGGLDKPHGDAQKGYFVRPTVISKVKSSMSIVREEIFGPVVVAEVQDSLSLSLSFSFSCICCVSFCLMCFCVKMKCSRSRTMMTWSRAPTTLSMVWLPVSSPLTFPRPTDWRPTFVRAQCG
jgi:phenylacetaldehyde dehydrogenase